MGQKSVALVIAFIAILGLIIAAVYYAWMSSPICGGAYSPPSSSYLYESEFVEVNGTGLYTMELAAGPNPADYDDHCDPELITTTEIIVHLVDLEGNTHFQHSLYQLDVSFSGDECDSDFKDNMVNQSSNVSKDNGTLFPVHFVNSIDNSLGENYSDGPACISKSYLSKGDKIVVYGSGSEADGPASGGWKLRLTFVYDGYQLGPDFVLPG